MKLKDLCGIRTNFSDADFWIVRRGSEDAVGKPTRHFAPEAIGIKVTKTDIVDPTYLFYWFEFMHLHGVFAQIATGTLRLVNIKTTDVANLPVNFKPSLMERDQGERAGMRNRHYITRKAAFRRWFAGSKAVDERGRPLIVYHGTRQDFAVFDPDQTGSSTDNGWFGRGIYLTPDPETASNYAQMLRNNETLHPLGHVMPLYVRALNPFVTDQQSMSKDYVQEILNDGHDSIFRVDYPGDKIPQEIVVFDPNQIKSAIGNRGTFKSDDPRVVEGYRCCR